VKLNESLSRKQLMQLELLIASVVPAVAILVVGVAGTAVAFNWFFVTLDVLTCAVAVFFGERSIILRMQSEMDEQLISLITACREYIKGNTHTRVSMPGDDQLAQLASTLNNLFDHQQTIANRSQNNPSTDVAKIQQPDQTSEQIDQLHEELEQLVDDISPALDGDLRVQSYIVEDTADETVAMVAELCNSLVTTLVELTKWTLSGCGKILKTSRKVLDRSLELAQSTEAQMRHLSQMIAAVEKVAAVIQRIESGLQLHVDMVEETYTHLQESKAIAKSREAYELLEQLISNTQRQIQSLDEIVESIHNTTTIAESAIRGLYTFAQQFHQSSTVVIKTTENINAIVTIAEDWFKNSEQLSLPEEE
jgi:methyl-accepting chemotaxis protein